MERQLALSPLHLLVDQRRRDERAGQVIGPGVIGAADQLAVAVVPQKLGAAMAAGVEEGAHDAVLAP